MGSACEESFEEAIERVAADRSPALGVEPVEVVTEPAGRAGEKRLDRADKMLVTALRAEGHARHAPLASLRKRHHRIAAGSEGAHTIPEPRLEGRARTVVEEREARLRCLEPLSSSANTSRQRSIS